MRAIMMLVAIRGIGAGLLAGGFLLAGCAGQGTGGISKASTPGAGTSGAKSGDREAVVKSTDPCATRLHEICGPLLLYYGRQRHLPDRLEELTSLPGFADVRDFTCPVSGKPYVYDPDGTISSAPGSHVILYDPEPSHRGLRYAVIAVEPAGNGPPLTKVVPLSESYFSRQPPKTAE